MKIINLIYTIFYMLFSLIISGGIILALDNKISDELSYVYAATGLAYFYFILYKKLYRGGGVGRFLSFTLAFPIFAAFFYAIAS